MKKAVFTTLAVVAMSMGSLVTGPAAVADDRGPGGPGGVVGPVGVNPVVGPAGPVGVGGLGPVAGPVGPVGGSQYDDMPDITLLLENALI